MKSERARWLNRNLLVQTYLLGSCEDLVGERKKFLLYAFVRSPGRPQVAMQR